MVIIPGVLSGSGYYATWSIVNKSTNITLSNGNLTYHGLTGAQGIGIASMAISQKTYWEVTIDSKSALTSPLEIGISRLVPLQSNNAQLGIAGTVAYAQVNASWILSSLAGHTPGTYTAIAAGQIISLAFDPAILLLSVYCNGVVQATLTVDAGTWYPACAGSGQSGDVCTTNFGALGAASFTYYNTIPGIAGVYAAGLFLT